MDDMLTVGITTRDRPTSVVRCVRSLAPAMDLITEIVVFDDGSIEPAERVLRADLPAPVGQALRVTRPDQHVGYIVGRNRIVRQARGGIVLLLDDDTQLLGRDSIEQGLRALRASGEVAAVAFAQAEADGRPWDAALQAAPVDYPCYVPSFIGFAHMVRRDVFIALGGYRPSFYFYGEEKEFCLRLIDAGHAVVYLPGARIAHVPDAAGRSPSKYLRYLTRNDCLGAILHDPWHRLAWTLPGRLALYFRMRRRWHIHDPGGFRWVVRELVTALPGAWRDRRPVGARTLRRWRRLRREWPAFGVEGTPLAP